MKTATIERYHVYGTMNTYMLRLVYRGEVLHEVGDGLSGRLECLVKMAIIQGYTQIKFVGF